MKAGRSAGFAWSVTLGAVMLLPVTVAPLVGYAASLGGVSHPAMAASRTDTSVPRPVPLASDDFSEANSTAINGKALDVGGTWVAPSWTVSAGRAQPPTGGGVATTAVGVKPFRVAASITYAIVGSTAGLVLHDGTNGRLTVEASRNLLGTATINLISSVGPTTLGTWSVSNVPATTTLTADSVNGIITIFIVSNSGTVTVGSVTLNTADQTRFLLQRRPGMMALAGLLGAATLDNFIVTAI